MEEPGYRNLTIRITDNAVRDHCCGVLKSYLHLRNQILITINRNFKEHLAQPEHRPKLFTVLTDFTVMRALLSGQKGGKKAEQVQWLRDYYANDTLMQEAISHSAGLKDKIIAELVKQIKQSWLSYFALKKDDIKTAREPKPKKLRLCSSYSLPIDMECVSFKNDGFIRILLEKGKPVLIPTSLYGIKRHVGELTNIKRMELSLKHGSIYMVFSHKSETAAASKSVSLPLTVAPSAPKTAAMDLGVNLLTAIYIDDKQSQSFAICGGHITAYNAAFNRKVAALRSEFDILGRELLAKEKAAKAEVFIAAKEVYRDSAMRLLRQCWERLNKRLNKLFRQRHHFLDTNFKKLAVRLLERLAEHGVTELVTSRQIIAKKSEGVAMGATQNQRFCFLPLGKLIDMIKMFAGRYGISVIDSLNEAYSSKTSCLSGDVVRAQELFFKQNNYDPTLRSDVFKGRRVNRGLFKDAVTGIAVHADINAAVNILKIHCHSQNREFSGVSSMFKLANPQVIGKDKNALLCFLDGKPAISAWTREQAEWPSSLTRAQTLQVTTQFKLAV